MKLISFIELCALSRDKICATEKRILNKLQRQLRTYGYKTIPIEEGTE